MICEVATSIIRIFTSINRSSFFIDFYFIVTVKSILRGKNTINYLWNCYIKKRKLFHCNLLINNLFKQVKRKYFVVTLRNNTCP